MNLKIIQLGIVHINDCLELDYESLKGLWTKTQWERELTDSKRICLGIINKKSKKIIGVCCSWLVLDELHLTLIAVHPNYQRKGLGKFLLSDLIKRSKYLRITQIHLEVRETNEPAKALYKSMGFKTTANRSNFYQDGTSALLLTKETN